MDERLDALLRLQDIDVKIQQAEQELDALPIRTRVVENERKRAQDALEQVQADLAELQKEAHFQELKLHSEEATLEKLQAQRAKVQTNREYAAITSQIGGAEADIGRLEDQVLAVYAKVDEVRKAIAAQQAEMDQITARRNEVIEANKKEADRISDQLEDLRRDRREAEQAVPAEALTLYRQMHRRLGGPPLAAVRDEVCAGCNMSVSPQTISRLRLARDLVQCTSCMHILYLDGDGS